MEKEMKIKNMNDIFREYDSLVGLTLLNIWSVSKEKNIIRLYHFDRKNKEHLFLLRIALIARDLYQFPIEIESSAWDIFCLNRKIRKGFFKVGRYKPLMTDEKKPLYVKGGICVPEVLDFMRPEGIKRLGEDFTFKKIYNQYYEGSLN